MIISIDPGKGFTKYCYDNNGLVYGRFPTKYTDLAVESGVSLYSDLSYHVKYKDQEYEVGINGKRDMRQDGTDKKVLGHRLAMLTAIGLAMNKAGLTKDDIYVVLSMPAEVYKDNESRKSYHEYFMGEGKESITIDGKTYTFDIKEILMQPEGRGYILDNIESMKGDTLIVDIGHLNTHFIELQDLDVIDMRTTNSGGFELENKVYTTIKEKNLDPDRRYIFKYIQEGYLRDNKGDEIKGSNEIITGVLNSYIKDIIGTILERGINLAMQDKIVFIGGTSELLKDYIQEYPDIKSRVTVSKSAVMDTVKGNLLAGIVEFEKNKEVDEKPEAKEGGGE